LSEPSVFLPVGVALGRPTFRADYRTGYLDRPKEDPARSIGSEAEPPGGRLFDLSPVGTLAIALAVAAWFAWSALMVQTDLSAGG
jgi:hypothetical protein